MSSFEITFNTAGNNNEISRDFPVSGVNSVTIPEGIETIIGLFEGFCNLREVNLPTSTKCLGRATFKSCISLERIDLTNINEIDCYCFEKCWHLKAIETQADSIGAGAFKNCTRLEKARLDGKMVRLSPYTFEGCESLEEVTIPEGVKTIGAECFSGCKSLKSINLPSSVKRIEPRAFANTGIKEILIPRGATVDIRAFEGCEHLWKINAEEVSWTLIRSWTL